MWWRISKKSCRNCWPSGNGTRSLEPGDFIFTKQTLAKNKEICYREGV